MDQPKEFEVVRLDPNDPRGWYLWPVFEGRVKRFAVEVAHESPELIRNAVLEARQLWTSAPAITGYWLVLDDTGYPFSHLLAKISRRFEIPFIEVIQWEVDKSHNALFSGVTDALLKELDKWNGGKFEGFEFTTERHADAWVAYLSKAGRVASPIRTVLYCGLQKPA